MSDAKGTGEDDRMNRMWRIIALSVLWAAASSVAVWACTFTFSYSEIEAPLGTTGEIGVRVQKTHNNCTLPGTDEYEFAWSGIQILDRTDWEDLGGGLYETWLLVSLSEVGDGGLTISKDCSKEGYEEKTLPIRVAPGAEGSAWSQALGGMFPFEAPSGLEVSQLDGTTSMENGWLVVGEARFELPDGAGLDVHGEIGTATLFYTVDDQVPLLLVSENRFIRLDSFVLPQG